MTTRRRLLGAMTALGLLPGKALAQDASKPQQYQCVSNVGTRDKIYANVVGTYKNPTQITGKYTYVMNAPDMSLGQGMTPFGDGPNGQIEFVMEQPDPKRPTLFMQNMRIKLQGFQYDREINPFGYTNVQATFMSAQNKPLFTMPTLLKRYSGQETLQAHLDIDMLRQYSDGSFEATLDTTRSVQKHFVELISQKGAFKIVFHDPARGTKPEDAILTYATSSLYLHQLPDLVRGQVAPLVARMNVGNCPEYSTGCFLTTAASDALGLPDDCWELETLRAFRDGPLQTLAEGPDLVERYYTEAPKIVDALPIPAYRRLWARTWLLGVLPAAILCRLGQNGAALRVYRRMFETLSAQI